MSFNSQFDDNQDDLVNDINMTPFIDVMLVLLIVFMITLPVINHAVKVNLPKANAAVVQKQADAIDISITADGKISWNKQPLSDDDFQKRITQTAAQSDKPDLHIFADQKAEYGRVSLVMSSAEQAGLTKLDFVVDKK